LGGSIVSFIFVIKIWDDFSFVRLEDIRMIIKI